MIGVVTLTLSHPPKHRRFKKEVSTDRVFLVLAMGNVAALVALLTVVILNRRVILNAIGL